MRTITRSVLSVTFLAVLAATSASASPIACDSGGPYTLDSSFACTLGGLTFSSFSLGSASGFNLAGSSVSLTGASILGGDVTLDFVPIFAATVNGSRTISFDFSVTGGILSVSSGITAAGGGTHAVTQTCSPICSGDPVALDLKFVTSGNPANNNGVIDSFQATFKVGEINPNPDPDPIPEPMTMGLIGSGLLGLGLLRKRHPKS